MYRTGRVKREKETEILVYFFANLGFLGMVNGQLPLGHLLASIVSPNLTPKDICLPDI